MGAAGEVDRVGWDRGGLVLREMPGKCAQPLAFVSGCITNSSKLVPVAKGATFIGFWRGRTPTGAIPGRPPRAVEVMQGALAMNEFSALSLLFAPTVIVLSALLVTGVTDIWVALRRGHRLPPPKARLT